MQQLLTGQKRLVASSSDNKSTDVGVIPEDWEIRPLSSFLDFRNGVNADKKAYGAGIPFINVLEVVTNGRLRASDIPGRISLSRNGAKSYEVRRGDLVFNRTSETQDEVGLCSPSFKPQGDLYVFVDECHRTQNREGEGFHATMRRLLPNAVLIGFTGTPLLKADKERSVEVFGGYIHTYKFDEAVKDGVVLDLRYEARDIDQDITSPAKIDQWFEVKTQGLTELARAQLKQRWGKMQKVLSSRSRMEKIVADVLMDMARKDRLTSGRGNALLVTERVYQACKLFELFERTELKGKCAIITSYKPSAADVKGEETGEGLTERLQQYDIYGDMLARWFNLPVKDAMGKVDVFEREVKKKFIEEPGQMKLLVVVDKLLTGFDAPSATYLYIDKQMRDHGLFQAICRVNRLDGEDKEYGYIVDYKHLFGDLEGAVIDYTSGALDGYDPDDVAGLLKDRLRMAKERLLEAREAVRALCEPCASPSPRPKTPPITCITFAQRTRAMPRSSRRTSPSGSRSIGTWPRSSAPSPTWPTSCPRWAFRPTRSRRLGGT